MPAFEIPFLLVRDSNLSSCGREIFSKVSHLTVAYQLRAKRVCWICLLGLKRHDTANPKSSDERCPQTLCLFSLHERIAVLPGDNKVRAIDGR